MNRETAVRLKVNLKKKKRQKRKENKEMKINRQLNNIIEALKKQTNKTKKPCQPRIYDGPKYPLRKEVNFKDF